MIPIVFENDSFLIVDKPAGVLSQKDKSADPDIADLLKKELSKSRKAFSFLAPIHRLDRNTSGLLILAKSSEAAAKLTDLLKNDKIDRKYLAVVKGNPGSSGTYSENLKKNPQTNHVFVDKNGDKSITHFIQLENLGNSSAVEVTLETGRSHQIRVHFAHHGHALIGDKKYAKKPWSEIFTRAALHSWKIEFAWQNEKIQLVCPIPADIKTLLAKMGAKQTFS